MMKFSNKIAGTLVSALFFVIILSFALTGFQGGIDFVGGGVTKVAKVDGNPVPLREYQIALNAQVDFYRKMMGGKDLTSRQIEQFGIKQVVLKRLIEKKLLENQANKLQIGYSQQELAKIIKMLPYFKRGEQFDVELYRNILKQNGLTPKAFEEQIESDEKVRALDDALNSFSIVSNNLANDIATFEDTYFNVDAVQFSKESLRNKIQISSSEVKEYLSNKQNKEQLETHFNRNQAKFNKPEEVKARHILVRIENGDEQAALKKIKAIRSKVTRKNFKSVANKETQDPSGKNNGGDLGWFSKGRMVPEFEKVAFTQKTGSISEPIKTQFGYHIILVEDKKKAVTKTFAQVQDEIAKEFIQKKKNTELDELFKTVKEQATEALKSRNTKKLDQLRENYGINLISGSKLNLLDKTIGNLSLVEPQINKIFTEKKANTIYDFGDLINAKIVYVKNFHAGDVATLKDKALETKITALNQETLRSLREDLMIDLESSASIVTYPNMM